ncbi:beta-glucoside-specific PTS transporter subunit IIABC [Tessaracoccus caeni]|uniref:beta-glucoside-specific PTS transporter subunit IIABC n=1 Tax=Tessaracoccus caeni TaxID=3031239 RepID=UPI0023DC3591|nr:beta-glucoside-specific PTS transporter subunit IIABC [Tessaracoccus caeni]MDF1487989.1 beta-glucoside-specific PTS transporter subunit IIABC [Tessaracoccus caeni]
MAVDFDQLADTIVNKVGGAGNIKRAQHCATRLRLELREDAKADTDGIKALDGVVTVVQAGGQYQVVIGDEVPKVHAGIMRHLGGAPATEEEDEGPQGNILDRFIKMVSSIFHPILWPLAGAGLFKAFLAMFATFGWVDTASTTYTVLNAASDALIYFLPIFLAVTSAKRFKANQFTAMAIAGALVYPSIAALTAAEGPLTIFGIPLVIMGYSSSVVPIIVGVWVQGYLERFLAKTLPAAIRNFSVPLVSMLVMVPLILLTIGPATTFLANGLASGLSFLFSSLPWLGGAIMGGFWQVFVMFGIHWGLVPIILQQLTPGADGTPGFTLLLGPVLPAVLAQASATLAVMLRTKDKATKQLAGPSALSGLLSGITEPAIYGVNLPRKFPFYFGIAGGVVGGLIAGIAGGGANTFVFPSLIGIPAFLDSANVPLFFIGCAVAVVIAFVLTFLWGVKDDVPAAEAAAPAAAPAPARAAAPAAATAPVASAPAVEVIVASPMNGRVVALEEVPDPVFSSGAMGKGVGIVPTDGAVYAPISGKIAVAMSSGHAYGIKNDQGVEVLVHVGIDTVNMKGEGFTPHVAKGDEVTAGQKLADVDLAAIEAAGYSTTTVMLVTNTKAQKSVETVAADTVTVNQPTLRVVR